MSIDPESRSSPPVRRAVPSWVWWTVVTLALWGVWAVLGRAIPQDALSAPHVQVISTLGMLPILLMLAASQRGSLKLDARAGVALALGAGVASSLGNIPYYGLLSDNKAAAVVPLTAMYPLVTVLLAVPVLNERLNPVQLLGVGASLLAMYVFNLPAEQEEVVEHEQAVVAQWLIVAFVPIFLWGLSGLLQKMSTRYISGAQSALWFLTAFLLVGAFMALRDPPPSGVAPGIWGLAVAIGFVLALGNYTVLLAYDSGGKASIIAPLTGLYPLISIPIAMSIWGETITRLETLGVACALVAVVLLALETRNPD